MQERCTFFANTKNPMTFSNELRIDVCNYEVVNDYYLFLALIKFLVFASLR